jgi:hypothetical protein
MNWTTMESELKRRRIGHTFKMRKKGRLLHEGKVVALTALRHWHGNYVYVLERLKFTKGVGKGTEELRLCYYDGRKFGQYAAVLPEEELRKLLRKAKREAVLRNTHWFLQGSL